MPPPVDFKITQPTVDRNSSINVIYKPEMKIQQSFTNMNINIHEKTTKPIYVENASLNKLLTFNNTSKDYDIEIFIQNHHFTLSRNSAQLVIPTSQKLILI